MLTKHTQENNMTEEQMKKYLLTEHKNDEVKLRPRHKGLDKIHYNTTKLDGTQKPFRFAISSRRAGKSTKWVNFYDYNYMYGHTILVLRRQIVDCTETYINDIENVINKFAIVPVKFSYKSADLKTGIVDVYVSEVKKDKNGKKTYYNERLFFRILGMSNPMSRIKSLMLPNIKYIFFDEFICNMKAGEKYLKDEAFKFREIYETFVRECKGQLITYFFGNPYSVYTPYTEWLGVDTRKLEPGAFIVGENYAIECYTLHPELVKQILQEDPMAKIDDEYSRYAFHGMAINDSRIPIGDKPSGAVLRFVFRTGGEYLGFYYLPKTFATDYVKFYCEKMRDWKPEFARASYCFDFQDASKNTNIFQSHQKVLTSHLKTLISNNRIVYKDISAAYLTEYIYPKL